MKRVSLDLSDKLFEKAKRDAKKNERTMSSYLRILIKKGL